MSWAALIPAAIQIGSQLLSKKKKAPDVPQPTPLTLPSYPTYSYKEPDYLTQLKNQLTSYQQPEWLTSFRQETVPQILAPADYSKVSPEVIDMILQDLREGTKKAGEAETYGLTSRGLLRSSIGERLLSDVGKKGLREEERFLGEVADIESQRKAAANENRLNRMTQFLTESEAAERAKYQDLLSLVTGLGSQEELAQRTSYASLADQWNALKDVASSNQTDAYKAALANYEKNYLNQTTTDYSGIGKTAASIDWSKIFAK